MIMHILFFILLFGVFMGGLCSKIYYAKVVDIEFEKFHDNWEADGKPTGGKKSRKKASFLKSDYANFVCLIGWFLNTPNWAKMHPEAITLLKQMRIYYSIFIFTLIGLIIVSNNLLGNI